MILQILERTVNYLEQLFPLIAVAITLIFQFFLKKAQKKKKPTAMI
jgi:hypothetical protein